MPFLPYDPGPLPTRPSPKPGDEIKLCVAGLPPYKDTSQSIRNLSHPRYDSFVSLRRAAIKAMDGRAWFFGPVALNLTIYAKELHKNRGLNDYIGGVQDTLDGSSGFTFTYLPIFFEDDCQICSAGVERIDSTDESYELRVEFLSEEMHAASLERLWPEFSCPK